MLNEYWKKQIKDNVLDLGTANGWDRETEKIFSFLREIEIPNTRTGQNLGRCYNAYGFYIELNGQLIEVRYRVDSSD
jgi:hypothetical protein